jgi:hypothetical protein
MMGINKERLLIFTGPKEDVIRYQKLFDHLKKAGYEVMVIEGVTECSVLRTPDWVYVGRADIEHIFGAKEFLEEETEG